MRFYASRTIRWPVRSCGNQILDCNNTVILTMTDSNTFAASALATLINAGAPVVQAEEDAQDDKETRTLSMLLNRHRKGL